MWMCWFEFGCRLSQSSRGPSDNVLYCVKERKISSVKCRNSGEYENTAGRAPAFHNVFVPMPDLLICYEQSEIRV